MAKNSKKTVAHLAIHNKPIDMRAHQIPLAQNTFDFNQIEYI